MQRWSRRTRRWSVACFAIGGISVIASLLPDWRADSAPSPELSPAETVAMRFPPGWEMVPVSIPQTRRVAARALDTRPDSNLVFNPLPTYPPRLARADPASADPAGAALPGQAMAYADPTVETTTGSLPPATGSADRTSIVRLPPERPAIRAVRAGSQPSAYFNEAQIAGIKTRLKLTAEQEQYWPPVEVALRHIALNNAAHGQRAAKIDPNRADVQRLKSAAIPLVMNLREEQKREVRMLAHVMGLGSVASQF